MNPCESKIPLNSNKGFFPSHSCSTALTFAVCKGQQSFPSHCGKADVWGFGNFVKGGVKRKHGCFSALTEEETFHWPVWSLSLFTWAELKRECWYSWGQITSEWRHRFLHNEQRDSTAYRSFNPVWLNCAYHSNQSRMAQYIVQEGPKFAQVSLWICQCEKTVLIQVQSPKATAYGYGGLNGSTISRLVDIVVKLSKNILYQISPYL